MRKQFYNVTGLLFSSVLLFGFTAINALVYAACNNPNSPNCPGGGGNSVPELDGSMGPLAVALLAGVIGIAVERKRRKSS